MKQYMLSVHGVEGAPEPAPDVMEQMFKAVGAFNDEVMAEGKWVFAGGLCGPESSTVVRVENGDVLITDGLFAETKEHLGGFWILKADDLDDALALAERGARACQAPVEVRPFQDDAED